jgi:hypothetical protein
VTRRWTFRPGSRLPSGTRGDVMFDVGVLAIAAGCFIVIWGILYALDRV